MATIVTRSGKGSPLTHNEVDANFTNLNSDKIESGDTVASLTLTSVDINGGTIDGTVIGGSTPAAISGTTGTFSGDLTIADKIVHSGDTNTAVRFPAADIVTVETAGSERMRIDSSGNVLVGTTSTGFSAEGHVFRSGDYASHTVDNDVVMLLNRTTSNGDIVSFRKNGTAVGSIGVYPTGNRIYIGTGDTGLVFGHDIGTGDAIFPMDPSANTGRDNAIDLGTPSVRFDDIHATNGTIQTSDRNEKQDIKELTEAEQRVAVAAKGLLRKFRWKSAVEEKGDDARIHFGIIAQDLQAAFEAEGLDAGRYGMFISSTWWEATETYTDDEGVEQTRTNTYKTQEEAPEGAVERTRMGVRYHELLAFIIAAI